jgi:hypothetical protein
LGYSPVKGVEGPTFKEMRVKIVEYVISGDWLGGADAARWLGNPAIDFLGGLERNWSNISGASIANGVPVSC